MTMMALDTLTVCLQATVRAGREVGFSQAAQRSQRRAAKLLAALEALKPAEDGADDGAWEEPEGLPPPPVQVRAAQVEVVPEKRKQTGEAVLGVLRAAGGRLPIAEVIARLPGNEAKAIRTAINGLQRGGKVQTLPLEGSRRNKQVELTPVGWHGGGPVPAEWRRRPRMGAEAPTTNRVGTLTES